MEELVIKNFGPINNVKIPLKKVMVFIGPQSSGKSTVAKLITILRNFDFIISNLSLPQSFYGVNNLQKENVTFFSLLKKYSIISYINKDTEIIYTNNAYVFNYKSGKDSFTIKDQHPLKKVISEIVALTDEYSFENINKKQQDISTKINEVDRLLKTAEVEKDKIKKSAIISRIDKMNKNLSEEHSNVSKIIKLVRESFNELWHFTGYSNYIPAERVYLPSLMPSLATIIKNKIPIHEYIIDYMSEFESARSVVKEYKSKILNVIYSYDGQSDNIKLGNNEVVKLENTSSGTQALIPMMVCLNVVNNINQMYVIEEPELNLYPLAQKELLYSIIENNINNNKENDLIITTHSPYILTCFNNLLYANDVAKNKSKEVSKIISKGKWLSSDKFGAFYIEKGKAKNIINKDTQLIEQNQLDTASDVIMTDFDRLTLLQLETTKLENGHTSKKTAKLSK